MAGKLSFQCGRCGRGLTVDGQHAGKKGVCPHCRNRFTIPAQPSGRRKIDGGSRPVSRPELEPPAQPRSEALGPSFELSVSPAPAPAAESPSSPEAAPLTVQPRCASCDAPHSPRASYCSRCGAPTSAAAREAAVKQAEAAEAAAELEQRIVALEIEREQLASQTRAAEEARDEASAEQERLRRRLDDLELNRRDSLKDFRAELLSLYEVKESLESRTRELEGRVEQLGAEVEERDRQLALGKASLAEFGRRCEELELANRRLTDQLAQAQSLPVEPLPQRLRGGVAELEYRTQGLFDSLRNLRKQLALSEGDYDELDSSQLEAVDEDPAPRFAEEDRRPLPSAVASAGAPAAGLVEADMFAAGAYGGPPPPPEERITGSVEVKSYRDIRSIGLDFGTTNSLLSYYKGVSVQGIFQICRGEREGYRELVLPSVLGFLEREDRFVFGYEAEDIPGRTLGFRKLRSIKRCLLCSGVDAKGRCANIRNAGNHDICGQGIGPWRLGRRRLETEEIIAEYLHEVFRRIERYYDVELTPEKIHFTVPVYFGYVARKKMRAAIKAAFQMLRGPRWSGAQMEQRIVLVHEPTAAAISQYNQFREMPDEIFAIFDMGGGTTDVAIYEKRRDNLWCLAADSVQVGGDDLDNELLGLIERKMEAWEVDRRTTEARRVLDDFLENLTAVREALSNQNSYERVFHFPSGDVELVITLAEFEEAVAGLLDRSVDTLVKVYEETQPILEAFEKRLGKIYLVGGVTKTPLVRRKLTASFAERAPQVRVRSVSKFVGINAPPEARQILEEEFNIVSVAVGAGFPEVNVREYLLDKVPFEIGVVVNRDSELDPLPVQELIPFYKACEPVPHRCSRRLKVSQNPGNRLNIYMKRDGQAFYKIIQYLKFPVRVGDELRYLASDKLCDLSYEIALEVTVDKVIVDFDGLQQETVALPGAHPYYLQRDINFVWAQRLSAVTDFTAAWGGRRKQIKGDRTQEILRRQVKERDPVELEHPEGSDPDGRVLVLHRGTVIGTLQSSGERDPIPEGQPFIRLLREDILLPADFGEEVQVGRSFRPGDPFIVFDIGFERA